MSIQDYYCSQKFTWLTVDLEKSQLSSCCAATPARIDTTWLKQNPESIFNTPTLIQERQQMLAGQPVNSCSATCWQPEARGLTSRRLLMKSNAKTVDSVESSPQDLHIQVGSSCNLTCSYCCKQFSTAWLNDITKNGEYNLAVSDDRYKINQRDRILMQLSQKDLANADFNKIIVNALDTVITNTPPSKVVITGGEPFLYLGLSELVEKLSKHVPVQIWSGLGVASSRLVKELNKIKNCDIEIVVSAENTGTRYEFNRYGNTWERFQQNLSYIDTCTIPYKFYATLSALTLHGLWEFMQFVGDRSMSFGICTDPSFLSVNVLDQLSKDLLLEQNFPHDIKELLQNNLNLPFRPHDKNNLKHYLKDFSTRRSLNLDIFPQHFLDWLNNE